jgi:hypothetical protein
VLAGEPAAKGRAAALLYGPVPGTALSGAKGGEDGVLSQPLHRMTPVPVRSMSAPKKPVRKGIG